MPIVAICILFDFLPMGMPRMHVSSNLVSQSFLKYMSLYLICHSYTSKIQFSGKFRSSAASPAAPAVPPDHPACGPARRTNRRTAKFCPSSRAGRGERFPLHPLPSPRLPSPWPPPLASPTSSSPSPPPKPSQFPPNRRSGTLKAFHRRISSLVDYIGRSLSGVPLFVSLGKGNHVFLG